VCFIASSIVNVRLPINPYSIYIFSNGWAEIGVLFNNVLKGNKLLVVSDDNVYPLYFDKIQSYLIDAGYQVFSAVVPAGEESKSLDMAQFLYTQALESGLDRTSAIVALGGGVIGDLAGFVASTYMRGIGLVQIPTTLLAQIDSSVGGKVAVNHPLGKNIIGSFYQPKIVYINTYTLSTLPPREFSTGMAELIKYGFIWEEELLCWLENNLDFLISRDENALVKAVEWSCRIKAQVVEQDEKEKGLRTILNFGHTVGHAIETVTKYSVYTHGEAVALGMICESRLAVQMGLIDNNLTARLTTLLKKAGLPIALSEPLPIESLIKAMHHDKKNVNNAIVFVLPVATGRVEIFKNVDIRLIENVLKEFNLKN